MQDTTLIHLDKSKESSSLVAKYYRLLDNSFEPRLSSYVDTDAYADKLVNNAYVAVLKSGEEFVGLFAVYINDTKGKVAYISSLAVMDNYKGQGYSQYLMDEAVKTAREAGMEMVRFEVKSSYTRAVKFHEKYGFIRSDKKTGDDSTFYMYMPLKENHG